MEPINIGATRNTPSIHFNGDTHTFTVIGNSIPENAGEFYTPVIDWLRAKASSLPDGTIFQFCLPYFNSSSLKALYLLLMEIKNAMDAGKHFEAIWHVEEDDDFMSEAAETFTELTGMEFILHSGILPATTTG